MAVPFLSVNLRTPACDFEPLMLAPDRPMLDLPAGQASFRVLRKWLGDLVAEPCCTSAGVMYLLPLDDSTSRAAARPQSIVPRDLHSGPIRTQYLKLWTLLSRVQPEAGEVPLLSAVCKSFESPDQAARLDQLGDCLFKYRDGQKQWRLVWAWGYRRKTEHLGHASLCPRCSLLTLRRPGETLRCPACGWRSRRRLLAAAALAALLIGLGLGAWAATRPRAAQPDIVRTPAASTSIARVLPVERPHTVVPAVPRPSSTHARQANETIAKITRPIQPKTAPPPRKPLRTAIIIKPAASPRPVLAKVDPTIIASTAPHGRVIAASRRPAAVIARSVSAPLPEGVRVDQNGKVYVGYRSVTPTFDATTQFSPSGNQPSRYIYGSHVYAESQDTLHGGEPAVQQWQHYVMDEQSDAPASADGSDHAVSLVLLDRGTDAEISNAASPGVDSWADTGSPVHLVQTSGPGTANPMRGDPFSVPPMPRFDMTLDRPEPFYPTTPRCHGKHHHGYGPYIQGVTDPALYRRFTPSPRGPALDDKLTVVALQYFGHSSPDDVLADLQAARNKAEEDAATPHSSGARQAILHLCDSEIALWRDVVSSRATADAATAAFKAGDVQHAGELCRDYQSQTAAYADRPEWSLFETESQQVAALAARLSSQSGAAR